MSQNPYSAVTDGLQFTTAEPVTVDAAGQNCAVCTQRIETTYFALADKLLCPSCREQLAAPPAGTAVGRLIKATILGLLAGLAGALIWYAVRRVANLEVGIVAILVGFMVGRAVRAGSGGRGGRAYQVLAVVLTYCCIAANYMPDIFQAMLQAWRDQDAAVAAAGVDNPMDENAAAADQNPGLGQNADQAEPLNTWQAMGALGILVVLVFAISLAAPFLAGIQNIIGLLIIGFALWEAWRSTARYELPISGPYQLAPPPAA